MQEFLGAGKNETCWIFNYITPCLKQIYLYFLSWTEEHANTIPWLNPEALKSAQEIT